VVKLQHLTNSLKKLFGSKAFPYFYYKSLSICNQVKYTNLSFTYPKGKKTKYTAIMKHKVELSWLGNLAYETNMDGHKMITDAGTEVGGDDKGFRPKKLMLTALAGCTGIDTALIVKKMRLNIRDIKVSVEGELTETQPTYYKNMHITYEFFGKDLPRKKLERAVKISEESQCGVSALYKQVIPVTSEIIYHEE